MDNLTVSSSSPDLNGEKSASPSILNVPKILAVDKAHSRLWKGICWHHSASPDGKVRDWPGIVKYHTSYRVDFNIVGKEEYERRLAAKEGKSFQPPWKAVGYHGGIELVDDGVLFNQGRPLSGELKVIGKFAPITFVQSAEF